MIKQISLVFTNNMFYKDGKMTDLIGHKISLALTASGSTIGQSVGASYYLTQENANKVMKPANCPLSFATFLQLILLLIICLDVLI